MHFKAIYTVMFLAIIMAGNVSANKQIIPQPLGKGIESQDYLWNAEDIDALELEGDAIRGAKIYTENCVQCHGETGLGTTDGSAPRISGQHFTVVAKQLSDFLTGSRDSIVMFNALSQAAKEPQQLADLAEYISSMEHEKEVHFGSGKKHEGDCAACHNSQEETTEKTLSPIAGQNFDYIYTQMLGMSGLIEYFSPEDKDIKGARFGPGTNLSLGKKLHERDCLACHNQNGGGSDENFYPIIAGQHYDYLYNEMRAMIVKSRRNAMPVMVAILKNYSSKELAALADYVSRIKWPEMEAE